MNWVFLLIAIVGEVTATTSMKISDGFSKLIPSLITIVGYGISFYFLSLALRDIPISIAYAVWAGVGIIFVSAIGYFYFKQSFDVPGVIGIALILCGVVIVNAFSKMAGH
jgi:small multidrug resistance pump